jgi:hypothetical protein
MFQKLNGLLRILTLDALDLNGTAHTFRPSTTAAGAYPFPLRARSFLNPGNGNSQTQQPYSCCNITLLTRIHLSRPIHGADKRRGTRFLARTSLLLRRAHASGVTNLAIRPPAERAFDPSGVPSDLKLLRIVAMAAGRRGALGVVVVMVAALAPLLLAGVARADCFDYCFKNCIANDKTMTDYCNYACDKTCAPGAPQRPLAAAAAGNDIGCQLSCARNSCNRLGQGNPCAPNGNWVWFAIAMGI